MPEPALSIPEAVGADSDAYIAAQEKRHLTTTMRGGQQAMRDAGTTYLPAFPGESTTDSTEYPARLARSTFFPFVSEAVGFAVGQVFGVEVALGEDVPEQIAKWAEDIDLRGNNLHVFAAMVFEDYWWDGAGVFLVDMPPPLQGATGPRAVTSVADAKEANRRPYWVRYQAVDVPGWRWEYVNGRKRLAFCKLEELHREAVDEYGTETEERRRRILWASPVDANGKPVGTAMHELWAYRKDAAGKETWVQLGERLPLVGMTEIPLVVLGALEDCSPLHQLAELNLSHWQRQSDVDNIEHIANVPVPYIAGGGAKMDDQGNHVPIRWAVNTLMELAEGATVGYIEHSGKCIAEAKKSLDKLEQEMGRRAMRSILETKASGQVTATSEIISAGRTYSTLQLAALRLKDALELGMAYTATYAGVRAKENSETTGGSVVVNQRFMQLPADAQTLEFLKWMSERGLLSDATVFAAAQGRDIVPDGTTYEEEKERVAEQGPKLGEIGADVALARRVVALIEGGMDPQKALAQAEAERDGGAAEEDEDEGVAA